MSAAGAKLLEDEKLPGGAVGIAREELNGRVLTIDAAGNLYLSRSAGKSWKKIKPKWKGKAMRLALLVNLPMGQIGDNKPRTKTPDAFQLTTDAGEVWLSEDGKHWRPQPEVKQ
jgi:hypothetical protein